MFLLTKEKRTSVSFKAGLGLIIISFLLSIFSGYFPALGANAPAPALSYLPQVGRLVETSPNFDPVSLRGLEFYPDNPFKFDFVLDHASADLSDGELQSQANRLLKYFFAALTIPARDFWVNLSPYEQDVVVPDQLGATDMGKDLLGEDYMLKQLSASLTCPNSPLGKKFWDEVYQRIKALYGKSDIPADTFNKVWIIPDKCLVVEDGNRGFIKESRLKVMLEEDYLATQHSGTTTHIAADKSKQTDSARKISVDVMREIILPVIEKEVNHGKNFLYLRQIYNALILATWFKRKLKDNILGQTYADQKKVTGIEGNDPQIKEKIYNQYLESYKQGAYNFIKKEFVRASGGLPVKIMRRKYFSGGFTGQGLPERLKTQLSVQKDSYLANAANLKAPAVVIAGAKPAAKATALKSALLGLVMLVAGCATSSANPVLPQLTAITEVHQNMDIPPGMYTLGEFNNNRPTVIFTHGAGGNPYEFEKFIKNYQNKYNIVVFTYKYAAPIQDSANFLTKSYEELIRTKHPGKVIFMNHSYGNNVFRMAVKMHNHKNKRNIYADAFEVQLAPTLAGSRKAIGGSGWIAKAATSVISAFGGEYYGDISRAQDPLGKTISELQSAPMGV